jgi:hypothetical protein
MFRNKCMMGAVALSLVLMLIALTAGQARADEYEYAGVTIDNPTDRPITFAFGFGKEVELRTLQPGKAITYSYPLDLNGRHPRAEISFMNGQGLQNTYPLTCYKTMKRGDTGMHYYFDDTVNGIELRKAR